MTRMRVALSLAALLIGGRIQAQDLFLLSVGIDRYQAPTNSLKGCVADAEGMARVFAGQAGKRFKNVEAKVLKDAEGTLAKINEEMKALEAKGKAGDHVALVLSGHGGIDRHQWAFLTQDNKNLRDAVILGLADRLATAGRKVVIIIDACHAGHLRYAASAVLNRHADPAKGGIVLMVSSMPDQLSSALGEYSAFARAVEEGLHGHGDLDGDGIISLKELRRFTYNQVYELARKKRPFPGLTVSYQDSAIDSSLSIPETFTLVQAKRPETPPPPDDGAAVKSSPLVGREWKITIPASKFQPPTIYELKLERTGGYHAVLKQGLRPASISNGVYVVRSKVVHLINHQGFDRLEITGLSANEFQFRFNGRTYKAQSEAVSPDLVVLDVSDRLSLEDMRDRLRRDCPAKVHKVKFEAGVTYIIQMESSAFDAYLRLEDASGAEVAEDDDGGGGRNARIRFTPTASGEFQVVATSYDKAEGVYHLHIERGAGPRPPDRTVAGALLLNVSHELTEMDAKDRVRPASFARTYKIELKKGVAYQIDMTSSDFDTYLRLEDSAGKVLTEDDDGGAGLDARINFIAPATASYQLVATSYRKATGRFTLTVKAPGVAVVDGGLKDGIPLLLKDGAARVTGELTAKDGFDAVRKQSHRKVYLVQLEGRTVYSVLLKSGAFDSFLRVEDETGKEIAHDDDGGGDRDARVVFTPPAAGTYRIVVTTFQSRVTGAYTLSVER